MRPVFKPLPEDVPFLRKLVWTIVALAVILVLWRASNLLMLAFGSVLGAVVFRTVARLFRRAGVRNPRIALALGIVFVLALFGFFGWLLTVQLREQFATLITNLPRAVSDVEATFSQSPVGEAFVEAARSALGGSALADILGLLAVDAGKILINFIIVMVGAIFIATDPRVYARGIVLLTPPAARDNIRGAISEVSAALRLWLNAQIICMTTMGLLIAGGLWLVGLESWAALGLLGGLSEFIPYVGPTLAMLPALALAADDGGTRVLQTLLVYFVIRMIQTNFITPLVTKRVVSIPPALTLFVILGMGAVFGVYGLFFSAALLVVAFVGVRELYLRDTLGEDIAAIPRAIDD